MMTLSGLDPLTIKFWEMSRMEIMHWRRQEPHDAMADDGGGPSVNGGGGPSLNGGDAGGMAGGDADDLDNYCVA